MRLPGRALPALVTAVETGRRGRDCRAHLDTEPGCDRCDGRLHYDVGAWRCASCGHVPPAAAI